VSVGCSGCTKILRLFRKRRRLSPVKRHPSSRHVSAPHFSSRIPPVTETGAPSAQAACHLSFPPIERETMSCALTNCCAAPRGLTIARYANGGGGRGAGRSGGRGNARRGGYGESSQTRDRTERPVRRDDSVNVTYHDERGGWVDERGGREGGGGSSGRDDRYAPREKRPPTRYDDRRETRNSPREVGTQGGGIPGNASTTMSDAAMMLDMGEPRCPMCAQEIVAKSTRRAHLALCCPDLIDPAGWRNGDGAVVRKFAVARHPKGSFRWQVVSKRFGWSDDDHDEVVRRGRGTDLENGSRKVDVGGGASFSVADYLLNDDPPEEYDDVIDQDSRFAVVSAKEEKEEEHVGVSSPAGTPERKGQGKGVVSPMTAAAVAKALNTDLATVTRMVRHELRDVPLQPDTDAPLCVIYEDSQVLAVAKPAGLMTYPAHRLRGTALVLSEIPPPCLPILVPEGTITSDCLSIHRDILVPERTSYLCLDCLSIHLDIQD
jgi:hypothetical protein